MIVVGVQGVSDTSSYQRWILKVSTVDGSTIWETTMPETEANMGIKSGYESVKFTSDGGFIVGGFANFDEDEFPNFKSGGQVDRGNPIFQKFSKATADATTMPSPPTPVWTWSCGGSANNPPTTLATASQCPTTGIEPQKGSANTMRIFTSGGVEQVVSTFRPSSIIIINAATGAEMAYQSFIEMWPSRTLIDKFQDIEVEFDSTGTTATSFVVAGLANVKDSTTLGCSSTSSGYCTAWSGLLLKVPYDLSKYTWRKDFSDFPGGINEYAGTTPFGGAMVYTECWSVVKAPVRGSDQYILACGQGIENCLSTDVDASLIDQCNGVNGADPDPRIDWRGVAIGFTPAGEIDWYRMANLGLFPGDTHHGSSAFEWGSYGGDPTTMVFFVDETLGFSWATMDLTTGGSVASSGNSSPPNTGK